MFLVCGKGKTWDALMKEYGIIFMENTMEPPQNIRGKTYHMIQYLKLTIYLKKPHHWHKDITTFPYSL